MTPAPVTRTNAVGGADIEHTFYTPLLYIRIERAKVRHL